MIVSVGGGGGAKLESVGGGGKCNFGRGLGCLNAADDSDRGLIVNAGKAKGSILPAFKRARIMASTRLVAGTLIVDSKMAAEGATVAGDEDEVVPGAVGTEVADPVGVPVFDDAAVVDAVEAGEFSFAAHAESKRLWLI